MVYMKKKEKISTIRVREFTKERLIDLDFARKNRSYDNIINELLDRYKK